MAIAPALSDSEFLSLTRIGDRLLRGEAVPAEHLLKLVGYRYVELRGGHYEATVTGLLRVVAGS